MMEKENSELELARQHIDILKQQLFSMASSYSRILKEKNKEIERLNNMATQLRGMVG